MSENNEETKLDPETKKIQDKLASQVADSVTTSLELATKVGQGFVRTTGVLFHKGEQTDKGTPVLSLTAVGPGVPDVVGILRNAGVNVHFDYIQIDADESEDNAGEEQTVSSEDQSPEGPEEDGEAPA